MIGAAAILMGRIQWRCPPLQEPARVPDCHGRGPILVPTALQCPRKVLSSAWKGSAMNAGHGKYTAPPYDNFSNQGPKDEGVIRPLGWLSEMWQGTPQPG